MLRLLQWWLSLFNLEKHLIYSIISFLPRVHFFLRETWFSDVESLYRTAYAMSLIHDKPMDLFPCYTSLIQITQKENFEFFFSYWFLFRWQERKFWVLLKDFWYIITWKPSVFPSSNKYFLSQTGLTLSPLFIQLLLDT